MTAVTGGHQGAGRRTVALAKAVTTGRVATGRALAAGAIFRTQAEVIVNAVDHLPRSPGLRDAAEQLLVAGARAHDATDLASRGRYVIERLDPDGAERRDERLLMREERAAHHGRFLSVAEDGIGGVRLRGRGTVEDAAVRQAVLFPLAAPEPSADPGACGGTSGSAGSCGIADCAHDGRDPREHGTRMWDVLIESGRLLLGTEVLPTSHGTRPRVAVTIGLEALERGLGTGMLDTGGTCPPPRSGRWPVTRRSCPSCWARGPRSSTSDEARDWSPSDCGSRWSRATDTVRSLGATGHRWPATPTTSLTGLMEV